MREGNEIASPAIEIRRAEIPGLEITGVEDLFAGPGLQILQERLMAYLPTQRWFGDKSRTIRAAEIIDVSKFSGLDAALVFVQLTYDDGARNVYHFPLAIGSGHEAEQVRAADPARILASVTTPAGTAIVYDAMANEAVRQAVLHFIESDGQLRTRSGVVRGHRSSAFAAARGADPLPARTGSAEQSNTSILYGRRLIMKLFRRLQPGENPDTEIGRFLTETAHFPRIAPFLGDITLEAESGAPTTIAMLQGLIENDGDGWQWTLDEISHYYQRVAALTPSKSVGAYASFLREEPTDEVARDHVGRYLDAAALLGRRTAEMHLALATPTENAAFVAEAFKSEDLAVDAHRIEHQLLLSLEALERSLPELTGTAATNAALVLSRRDGLLSRARAIASAGAANFGQRTRVHGDYHLGQVLRSHGDYVILDFEGEPAKTLAERRRKQSPLKDVAGMLRSFGYAAYAGLHALGQKPPEEAANLDVWADVWQNAVSVEFLRAYRSSIDEVNPQLIPRPEQAQRLLDAYLLEKALYELRYELDNRRAWVRIPLAGILTLH